MKYFSIILCALVVFAATEAQAQENEANSASIYSYLGLGTPQDILSSQGAGMAIVGVATPDRSRASLANPAFWGSAYFTSMSAGFNLQTHDATDNFGSSSSTTLGFSHFQAQFPVIRDRLGLSIGMYQDTNIRYNLLTNDSVTLPTADSLSVIDYQSAISGTGGINRIEAGFGLRITDNFYVGYAPSLMFGLKEQDNQFLFNSPLYGPARFTERTRYRAFAHRFGTMILLPNVFRGRDQLIFGATATLPVELSANRRITSQLISGNTTRSLDLIPESTYGNRDVTFPFETTVGLTYFASRYFMVATEAHYQQWSEHNSFNGEFDENMKDRLKVGLGLEYDVYSRGNPGLFNSLIYRAGASYDDGHLTVNNTNIETLLFTAGIGIPSRTGTSSIDINLEYGIRGTQSNDLVRERIFGVRLSLNLSELMFLQRRVN